jgi:hypothetical protein
MHISIETIQKQIADARLRLSGLIALPRKSDVDLNLIADLREYIAGLNENLGELKREQAGRERGW